MPIRITGMNSGLDTDSIIQALMSAYRVKGDNYKKEQTKISWKQDKWKALNTKVYNLYKSLDNLRFTSGYNLKKVTVSDTTKATVSGTSNAMNGTQTLKINQLAQAAYLTGDKISAENGNTTLSELDPDFQGGNIRISGNGVVKDIELTKDTTVNDFIKQVNESGTGVSASYDNANKRIFISSQKTGVDAGFDLTALDEDGNKAMTALGLNFQRTVSAADKAAWEKYYDTANSAVKTDALKANIEHIISQKKALEEKQSLRDEELLDQKFNQDAVKYLEAKSALVQAKQGIDASATDEDASAMAQLLKMSEANQAKTYVMDEESGKLREKKGDGSDDNKVTYKLTADKIQNGDKTETKYTFEKGDPTTGSTTTYTPDEEAIANLKNYSTNQSVVKKFEKEADADAESGDYGKYNVTQISDADLTDELEGYNKRLEDNKNALADYKQEIKDIDEDLKGYAILGVDAIDADASEEQINEYVKDLTYRVEEFNQGSWVPVNGSDGTYYQKDGANPGAKMVQGSDAEIELNGVSYTSSSNSFSINGLSIQAQAKTNGDEVTVTTATDTQGIYDKIKDFISEYNSLIAEIGSLYNAESAKGYEPLTSDEKEAMSDKEVEEWETKVKDALLRRDDSLGSLMNSMTSAMLSSVKIGDKSYSLASLGIKTTGYFHTTAATRNELHIDGDEDDDTTSSKSNTLMNMLNSDPDKAIDIIKGVVGNLYNNLNKKMMTSNSMKSINTIYNDKEMSQSYSDYTKTIRAWEEKMQTIEDNYYKQFSAMEVALSKLQSQQSSLAGLLGQ